MERTEPVYRRDDERFDTSTNGRLVLPVSGFQKRNMQGRTNIHCRTMRLVTGKCVAGYHRPENPGTGPDNISRRAQQGAFMLSNPGTEQGLNARDAYVTCTRDVALRLPVTYASHYPEWISRRVIPCSVELRNPFLSIPIQNGTPQRLTAGVRNRTQQTQVSRFPLRGFDGTAETGRQGTVTMRIQDKTHPKRTPCRWITSASGRHRFAASELQARADP